MAIHSLGHARVQTAERRGDNHLRERFEEACRLLTPLVCEGAAGSSAACYKAMRRLHEAYPDLSPAEVEALASAVCRALKRGK